jgi:MAP/microtubule affinity-regulating kinase
MLHSYTYANLFREPTHQVLGVNRGFCNIGAMQSHTRNNNYKDSNITNTIKYRTTINNQQALKTNLEFNAYRIRINNWELNESIQKFNPQYLNYNTLKQDESRSKSYTFISDIARKRTQSVNELENYEIEEKIGEGAYAIVKSGVQRNTGRRVAIKIYDKNGLSDPQRKACIDREISIQKSLRHPNIVQLHEAINANNKLFLIMELVKGKSLVSYINSKVEGKLEELDAMQLFTQIAAGISYCHTNNIIHRDIKMANVLIDDEHNVKIIDFGFSVRSADNHKLKVRCGTSSYMAPEVLMRKEYYGKAADVWSLGVLLFVMLAGRFPYP